MRMDREAFEKRRAEVAKLTRAGYSATDIAAHLKISERTVQRHRNGAGICVYQSTPLTDDEISRARNLLEDGASYSEVARTINRSMDALKRHFPGYGWTQAQAAEYRHARERLDGLQPVLSIRRTA